MPSGYSKAFSRIVAVFSETNTCLATYLVGKLDGAFSTRKLTGSPVKYKLFDTEYIFRLDLIGEGGGSFLIAR